MQNSWYVWSLKAASMQKTRIHRYFMSLFGILCLISISISNQLYLLVDFVFFSHFILWCFINFQIPYSMYLATANYHIISKYKYCPMRWVAVDTILFETENGLALYSFFASFKRQLNWCWDERRWFEDSKLCIEYLFLISSTALKNKNIVKTCERRMMGLMDTMQFFVMMKEMKCFSLMQSSTLYYPPYTR